MAPTLFSERLRHTRESRKISQKKIAELTSIKPTAYSNYENGVSEPSFENLGKIISVLGVTADFLLGLEDKNVQLMEKSQYDRVVNYGTEKAHTPPDNAAQRANLIIDEVTRFVEDLKPHNEAADLQAVNLTILRYHVIKLETELIKSKTFIEAYLETTRMLMATVESLKIVGQPPTI